MFYEIGNDIVSSRPDSSPRVSKSLYRSIPPHTLLNYLPATLCSEPTLIKRIVLTLLQFLIFIALLAIGGNWDVINLSLQIRAMEHHTTAFNPIPVIKTPLGSHILIADGLLFAAVLLVLILLIELLTKKLKPWAGLTLLAFALAICLGFAMKLGLPPAPTPDSSSVTLPTNA